MQLLRSISRSSKLAHFARPAYLTQVQAQNFSAKPQHFGDETTLADVADVFKVNYTVEYD